MKHLFIIILIGLSKYSFACSSYASMGFCQNIINDTSYIVLGVKLGDHVIYDSLGENVTTAGMPFRIIETFRGTIPYDTITVWSDVYDMCTWGTFELSTGDTFLIKLHPSNFTVDTLESFPDYTYPNSEWPFTTALLYSNDTLSGLVYQNYTDYWMYPHQYPHPVSWQKMTHVAYQDFKQNIQNGLVCYDYTSVEDAKLNSFNAYPNPCTNVLHLEIDNGHDFDIKLYDAMGKVISTDVRLQDNRLDVSSLTPGIYFLHVQDGSKSRTVKFLKAS